MIQLALYFYYYYHYYYWVTIYGQVVHPPEDSLQEYHLAMWSTQPCIPSEVAKSSTSFNWFG